jgi:hypothetical protein
VDPLVQTERFDGMTTLNDFNVKRPGTAGISPAVVEQAVSYTWPPEMRNLDILVENLGGNPGHVQDAGGILRYDQLIQEVIKIKSRDNVSFLMGSAPLAYCPKAAQKKLAEVVVPKARLSSTTKAHHDLRSLIGIDQFKTRHIRKRDPVVAYREHLLHQQHILRKV